MKAFFDSSALIPLAYGEHPHHEMCVRTFLRHDRRQACCGAHTLAEVYSALTRMPGTYRVSAEQAILFIASIRQRLATFTLDSAEYVEALEGMAERGIIGGAVYDGLLIRCAIKARAEVIYTWNIGDFQRFGPEIAKKLRTPA